CIHPVATVDPSSGTAATGNGRWVPTPPQNPPTLRTPSFRSTAACTACAFRGVLATPIRPVQLCRGSESLPTRHRPPSPFLCRSCHCRGTYRVDRFPAKNSEHIPRQQLAGLGPTG